MKRADFIKKIIGFWGIAVLPKALLKQYTRLYLLQCFVRGFRFYEGPKLLEEMKEGDMLELVREPDNPHDPCAIALHFNRHKIGYIPSEQNELLSRLIDADVIDLLAEITKLEPAAAAWENVHIAIYILKEDAITDQSAYLAVLDTPHYYTLKHRGDKISRFSKKGKDIPDGDAFYEALVENSKTDKVYDLIHNDIGSPEAMEAIVDESLLVINRDKVPADLQTDRVLQAFEEGMATLDNSFDEKGYVVAEINRVAELSARIKKFVAVKDKKGGLFWEVLFEGK